MGGVRALPPFPNPVNEKAARVVAGVVAVAAMATLLTDAYWLLVPIAYGFGARTLAGPAFSPLGRLAVAVAPRLGPPEHVPGPPKRFAQAVGAVITTLAAVLALALGWTAAADVLLAVMVVFATLESVWAFCAGCAAFGLLMRAGVIPEKTCEACSNIWAAGAPGRPPANLADGRAL